jgi:hypothetical protein
MLAGCLWLFCSERKGLLVADKQGNRALRCTGEGRARSMEPTSAGVEWLRGWEAEQRPVRLAYQPPASSTFLSEQTSHQQPASSTYLSEQATSQTNRLPNGGGGGSSERWDAFERVVGRLGLLLGSTTRSVVF